MTDRRVCVDASFFVNLLKTEDSDSSYQEIWQQWQVESCIIVAPTLMIYEVCNALYRAMVAGQLLPDETENLLERILNLDIALYGDADLHRQALKIARRETLSASYDAHYLALAEQLGIEFWTGDRRLYNTVRSRLSWVHLVS